MLKHDLATYFDLSPVGSALDDIDTPVPIIDLSVVARNIHRWQQRCDRLGLANRPHIKTHKLVPLARAQIAAGAKGLTVQKLGEAEVMADAGIRDLLLTFNVVGRAKVERLAALARRTDIAVTVDNDVAVEGVAAAGTAAGRRIRTLIETDTGAGRCGVQSPADALSLGRKIVKSQGMTLGGLMTYPKTGGRAQALKFLLETRELFLRDGLPVDTVSTGGTPDMWSDDGLSVATEYRAGTYIYNDRSQISGGSAVEADCALTVLATVVSRPTPERAIIDAGSKALTSDLLGLSGYGALLGDPGTVVYNLSEEHGFVDVTRLAAPLRIGDRVRVVPNHVCPVSNLFDRVVLIDGDRLVGSAKVDARGMVR
jgi:D-serine deaminase-like pyridoxal phosphate-dependent protein